VKFVLAKNVAVCLHPRRLPGSMRANGCAAIGFSRVLVNPIYFGGIFTNPITDFS
jgi:hypothetical protein